ncbi:hypothetical protein ACEWY4_025176 [Coilia grayii]|uniref:Uncharacterized protein n=1 Tax=Coilia grayii TaxID=363190 RepID=A0ABD1IWT4_9TELE
MRLSRLYCGPLVHQAALRLRSGMSPESFLSAGPFPMQLFVDLQNAVLDSLDANVRDRLQKASRPNSPRQRRTKSVGSMDELVAQFQHFEVEDDEDEDYGRRGGRSKSDDDEDGQLRRAACHIRTRHKKKSRNLHPLNKRDRVNWA